MTVPDDRAYIETKERAEDLEQVALHQQEQIEALKHQLADRDERIGELEEELGRKHRRVEELEQAVRELSGDLDEQVTELRAAKARVAELRRRLDNLH